MMVSRELSRSLSLLLEKQRVVVVVECPCPCCCYSAFIALNSSPLPNRPCGFSLAMYCCCHRDWLQACPFCYYGVSHHHRRQEQSWKKCPQHTRFPRRKSKGERKRKIDVQSCRRLKVSLKFKERVWKVCKLCTTFHRFFVEMLILLLLRAERVMRI